MLARGFEPVGSYPVSRYRIPGTSMVIMDAQGDNTRMETVQVLDNKGKVVLDDNGQPKTILQAMVIDPVIEYDIATKRERLAQEIGVSELPELEGGTEDADLADAAREAAEAWDNTPDFSLTTDTNNLPATQLQELKDKSLRSLKKMGDAIFTTTTSLGESFSGMRYRTMA